MMIKCIKGCNEATGKPLLEWIIEHRKGCSIVIVILIIGLTMLSYILRTFLLKNW